MIESNNMANNQVNLHKNIEKLSVFSGIFSRLVRIQWHLQPARDCFSKSYILYGKSRQYDHAICLAAKRLGHRSCAPRQLVESRQIIIFSSQIPYPKLLKSRLELSPWIMACEPWDAIFDLFQPYAFWTSLYWFCYIIVYILEWVHGPYLLRSEKFK